MIQINIGVVPCLLSRHNGRMNTNIINRDARYLAEAKKILDQGEHLAMHIIMHLLKDAGWEPDMTTEDGWLKK